MPASRPFLLGLTGGIGCGKSEAAAYLASLGAAHVDADAISRSLTAPGGAALDAIRARFGERVFRPDGALDRAALGAVVFASEPARRDLEAIIHPRVHARMAQEIDAAARRGDRVAVLDVPLLFETGMDALCGEVWAVSVSEETQIARVVARGLTEEQARRASPSQMPRAQRNARAARVIDTDRPVEETRAELARLYRQLLARLDGHGRNE